uniref:PGG domain-containing protein n=1 Tax=Fagus sylvatica TaxID=28930 RepID=A0A2N9HVA0_FAGSY
MEDFSQYASFRNNVHEGNWDSANQFLSSHPEALSEKISNDGDTALHIAFLGGHMDIVKELVNKMSEEILKTKNNCGSTVLGICAQIGNIEMAKCIIGKSQTLLSIGNYNEQLIPVVLAIENNPNAIDMVHYLYDETPKEDLMPGKGVNGATFITQCIYAKAFDLALDLLRCYPTLALALDANKQAPLLALASVSFAYPSGNQLIFWKQWIYDTTLEPSARRNTVPGAAFLMQREVQWFKKVESIVQPFLLEAQNHKGQTPQELFRESHKELVKEGEKWMKETATSCTVAGALIVTIMFAAAITVPGARYAEEDFLKSLPNKMIIGLSTLIFSIATMMTTFCASLFIILPGKSRMVIPLVCLAGVPVVVFAWMQFGLLIDMVISTYRPGILDKKVKRCKLFIVLQDASYPFNN